MQLKHVAALLLPLSGGVMARPIQPRSDNGLLNIFSTVGGAGDANEPSFLGIFKRQITGISFDPISMMNKMLGLQGLPIVSGLRKRDAEPDGDQDLGIFKRGGLLGLDCLLNIGGDVSCADQGTSSGLLGKRQLGGLPGLNMLTSLLGGFGGLGGKTANTPTTPSVPNSQQFGAPQFGAQQFGAPQFGQPQAVQPAGGMPPMMPGQT